MYLCTVCAIAHLTRFYFYWRRTESALCLIMVMISHDINNVDDKCPVCVVLGQICLLCLLSLRSLQTLHLCLGRQNLHMLSHTNLLQPLLPQVLPSSARARLMASTLILKVKHPSFSVLAAGHTYRTVLQELPTVTHASAATGYRNITG